MLKPVYSLEMYLLCHLVYSKKTERERHTHWNSQLVIISSKMGNTKIARIRKKENDISILYSYYESYFFAFSNQGQTSKF